MFSLSSLRRSSNSSFRLCRLFSVRTTLAAAAISITACSAPGQDLRIANKELSVVVRASDGAYEVHAMGDSAPVFQAIVGAKVDGTWLHSSDYPQHQGTQSDFQDELGHGSQVSVAFTGLSGKPELRYAIRVYETSPFAEIQVQIINSTASQVSVQALRVLESVGKEKLQLGANAAHDRVLSDSFGENRPLLKIYDLGQAPKGLHRGVGSQLVYNRDTRQSFFVGALTTNRFLTLARLQTEAGPKIASYVVDCTGTTELQSREIFPDAPAEEDRIELSLPVAPGSQIQSERVMLAAGRDYHAQLEAYGAAIRIIHHARVDSDNLMGWWSWTALYRDITAATLLTNAQWMAESLTKYGYNYFHIDSGYEYAPGEYETPNAARFPRGVRPVAQDIARLGFKVALWTAPFYVGTDSRTWELHKDWLVHNAQGAPIRIMRKARAQEGQDIYVLDTTHPGAQEYLRNTYHTMVREWGLRYIKLDFMDSSSIEGYRYRPNTTALEAQRIGLKVIREAVGEGVLLDKDASDMLNPVGILDEGRISQDTAHSFAATRDAAPAMAARYYMHRNFYVSDPDAFNLSRQMNKKDIVRPLTLDEAQVSIALSAISGGMFEIGDDLPSLASDPERFALVTNPDLLQIAKLSRAFTPLDLMSFRPEDEMPSVFLLQESHRQWILAVFNWTERPQSHAFTAAELGLARSQHLELFDAFAGGREVPFDADRIVINSQLPHSVRLLKIVDEADSTRPPTVNAEVQSTATIGEAVKLTAVSKDADVPALAYHWDCGDGVLLDGANQTHAYTMPGTFHVVLSVEGIDGVSARREFSVVVSGRAEAGPPRRYQELN
jgi:alpha-galactosidase